jgi:hypothetical protein
LSFSLPRDTVQPMLIPPSLKKSVASRPKYLIFVQIMGEEIYPSRYVKALGKIWRDLSVLCCKQTLQEYAVSFRPYATDREPLD